MTVNGVSLKGLSRKQAADIIQGEKVRKAKGNWRSVGQGEEGKVTERKKGKKAKRV